MPIPPPSDLRPADSALVATPKAPSPPPSAPEAPQPPAKRWGKLALRLLVLALILFLVARVLPLSDQLSWQADGKQYTIEGEIRGDWKATQVDFVPAPDAKQLPPLPQVDGALRAERVKDAAAGAIQVEWRPSLARVFRGLEKSGLALALGCIVASVLVTSSRWWTLLRAADCPTPWFQALRLTALGFFFNLVVPGLTGGDWVKAVLAAREHPERRTAAAVSVFVDRIIGLAALLILGCIAALIAGERLAFLRLPLAGSLLAAALGTYAYCSQALRQRLGVDRMLERLPLGRIGALLRQIDGAVFLYSRRKPQVAWAVLLSFVNHFFVVATFVILGHAFGEDILRTAQYVVIVSVGNTASAVPLAPGGWGVGEYIFGSLFDLFGASSSLGIAVSVTYRILLLCTGLFCGLFLLAPNARREWRAASQVSRT